MFGDLKLLIVHVCKLHIVAKHLINQKRCFCWEEFMLVLMRQSIQVFQEAFSFSLMVI